MKRLCDILKEHFFTKDKTMEDSIQSTIPDLVPQLSKEEQSRQYEQNRSWFDSHYNDLFDQYKGKFVAVSNERVIACERDGEKIMSVVERMNLGKRVIIAYFDPVDRFYSFT